MVRESTICITRKAMRAGKVCLNGTGNDVGSGTLGSNNHVNAHGTRQLGDACNGKLHIFTRRHDKVAKLVDDHHDVRHKLMSLFRIQATVDEFFHYTL